MKEKKTNGKGKLGQRFRKADYGARIMKMYAWMKTAEVARQLGLTEKQVKNFVYRENVEDDVSKNAAVKSRINSENGKKGGRPRKKVE